MKSTTYKKAGKVNMLKFTQDELEVVLAESYSAELVRYYNRVEPLASRGVVLLHNHSDAISTRDSAALERLIRTARRPAFSNMTDDDWMVAVDLLDAVVRTLEAQVTPCY